MFYLHPNVLGIVSEEHAAKIVVDMLRPTKDPNITVHPNVTLMDLDEPKIAMHDAVKLIAPIPELSLAAGKSGTVIHIYQNPLCYEVEFLTHKGNQVVTLDPDKITQ